MCRVDGTPLPYYPTLYRRKTVWVSQISLDSFDLIIFCLFSRCVDNFNEFCKYPLFAFFAWNLLSLSSLLVALQFQLVEYIWFWLFHPKQNSFFVCLLKWEDNFEPYETMVLSILAVWIFGFNFIICESGERVSKQFALFEVEFGQCEWSKLPIEMQVVYLIFLTVSQQPIYIQGYGGSMCTRETFKQVYFNRG